MKMVYKISIAAIALLSLALIAAPAFAQLGPGGACGGAVAYGPPQDCIAQVYCNVPVTTEVPVMTCTQVPQEVPVVVPVQSSVPVTVPRVVVVPETCEVPVVTATMSSTTVPVTVPVQSSVPVTNLVPQSYTVPLGCPSAPAAAPCASPCDTGIGASYGAGPSYGAGASCGTANPNLQSTLQGALASNVAQAGLGSTASWNAAPASGTAMPASGYR